LLREIEVRTKRPKRARWWGGDQEIKHERFRREKGRESKRERERERALSFFRTTRIMNDRVSGRIMGHLVFMGPFASGGFWMEEALLGQQENLSSLGHSEVVKLPRS
jgi:hypothetical protein